MTLPPGAAWLSNLLVISCFYVSHRCTPVGFVPAKGLP